MNQLTNKQILLGVTGGIAAYKSAELIRFFNRAGAKVRVVMTASAIKFITPLTLHSLSGYPVHHNLLDHQSEAAMSHIELARWADLIVVAPASADFIARLAAGQANDLLTTLCLASKAQIVLAPAMNQQMWLDGQTQANVERLQRNAIRLLGPAEGEQACGEHGPGRMLEPEQILQSITNLFVTDLMTGLHVLITAGPTREMIDPVRYISNRSSGKMGYALAQAAIDAGAKVTLVSGPVQISPPDRVKLINVTSADEMAAMVFNELSSCDIIISAGAVTDYKSDTVAKQKIKKTTHQLQLNLMPTIDILAEVAARSDAPFTVGFAAETEDCINNAADKRYAKQLDMIVVNDVAQAEIGFDSDDNAVTVLWQQGEVTLEVASKRQIAKDLLPIIMAKYNEKQNTN